MKIAATLPNVPIVGEYLEHAEDFGDHAQEMVINEKGVKFVKRTVPFGVVPADTKIWWQWFIDDDGVEREYLMCQGFLWTGRYPQVNRVLESGNGQSMEFDPDTMMGQWAIPENESSEYFIVSDAVFIGLCILGEDVEPCFEGANIGAPSVVYSLDKDKYKLEMPQFMLDLKGALNNEEGGNGMTNPLGVDPLGTEPAVDPIDPGQTGVNDPAVDPNNSVDPDHTADPGAEPGVDPADPGAEPGEPGAEPEDDFAKKKKEGEEDEEPTGDDDDKEPTGDDDEDEDKNKKKAKYNLEEVIEYAELSVQYAALEEKYNALVAEFEGVKPELHSLREMKVTADTAAKNNMVAKFYMLDEEDIKEVRENIANYSVEEIESKLSVIAVRKKVNFNLDDANKNETNTEDPIVSFSAQTSDNMPAWLRAVDNVVKSRN